MSNKPKIFQSALAAISGELKKVRAEYDGITDEIRKVKAEIQGLQDMPVSLEDFGTFLKKSIEAEGKKYLADIGEQLLRTPRDAYSVQPMNAVSLGRLDNAPLKDLPPERGLPAIRNWLLSPRMSNITALNSFKNDFEHRRMLCCFMPEKVYEIMFSTIKEQVGGQWGNDELPSVAERREGIARLQEELGNLEAKRRELAAQLAEFGQMAAVNAELEEITSMANAQNP